MFALFAYAKRESVTTSASFINTRRSFMSLLDNYQLKIVTNVQITK